MYHQIVTKLLLQNLDYKLRNCSMIDYCIIMLGETDFEASCTDYAELLVYLREAIQYVSNTNIIYMYTYVCV